MMIVLIVVFLLTTRQSYGEKITSVCNVNNGGNKLDCTKRNLTSVPVQLIYEITENVTEIDFSHNQIDAIEWSYISMFKNVEILRFTDNKLNTSSIEGIANLTKLRELYVDNNTFSRIPSANVASLQILSLNGNLIKFIDGFAFRGLPNLRVLLLADNSISDMSRDAFKGVEGSLHQLSLKKNRLRSIPSQALMVLKNLLFIELSNNQISEIQVNSFLGMSSLREFEIFDQSFVPEKQRVRTITVSKLAFRNMKSLLKLHLYHHHIVLGGFPDLRGTNSIQYLSVSGIDKLYIPPSFCLRKKRLQIIRISLSNISAFPILNECSNLRTIDLVQNNIRYIGQNSFSGLPFIKYIEIFERNNNVGKVHRDAFRNLPSLLELDLSHYPLFDFPNLNGTTNLRLLKLQHCNLKFVPGNICRDLPNLEKLDLSENSLAMLPSLSECKYLKIVDLFKNRISTVAKQFSNMENLEYLKLSDNHLRIITNDMFKGSPHLSTLYLDWNIIHQIEAHAFQDIRNLEVLNVSFNKLTSLPTKGLRSLLVIDTVGNKNMIKFPTQLDLPFARQLRLVYPYHCCYFMENVRKMRHDVVIRKLSTDSSWSVIDTHDYVVTPVSQVNGSHLMEIEAGDMEPLLQKLNNDTKLYFHPEKDGDDGYMRRSFNDISDDVYCSPEPNDFYPCEDLMGKEWLRICVWLVFFLALFGNLVVLIVLIANCTKMDVPRCLIMNLAFADLCLGIYIGILAFEDISTLGNFRMHGLEWQMSTSCRSAGFLAVFASELSVYTLSVITIERFTTIKNSMHVEKRMTMRQAVIIMGVGWLLSIILASLPLYTNGPIKFSDYSKYSVCLPFEIETLTSKMYVSFVLIFNIAAFVVILACYVRIYLFIHGSCAWNSGDLRVARRMAILVFVDFFCWFPIAFIALSAVFKMSLIGDLWISKVLTIFVFPLNACANPFLYAILTKQFRKDIMLFVRHVKEKSFQRDMRKSILKTHLKNSLTYSSSVRRGSSFSFLFGRRCSSKPDELALNARMLLPCGHKLTSNERGEGNEENISLGVKGNEEREEGNTS